MKIFISWSGNRSNQLARILKELLPEVIQESEVWMSEHDIQVGTRWSESLSSNLSQCDIGIACLTAENLSAPWLLFEAGAISKSVHEARFIPFLLDLDPSEVKPPLSQFQLATVDIIGFTRIVESLNSVAQFPLSKDRLKRQIERCWPETSSRIDAILKLPDEAIPIPERSDSDMLRELLSLVRASVRHKNPHESLHIWIDPRLLDSNNAKAFEMFIPFNESVTDFLDRIWSRIRSEHEIPPYTYGEKWLLKCERTGEVFRDIARNYILSGGKVRDNRPLSELQLDYGDVILLVDPKNEVN
jgi:hypothetical protein